MSFAEERFLSTGTYAIMNAEYNKSITFSEQDQCLSTSNTSDYGWTISLLKNKKWTIQGSSEIFIDIGPYPEEGEGVVSMKNPPKAHEWVIKRHPDVAQSYMIYSPSHAQLFWSLSSADEGTIPLLSVDPDSASSLWKFKKMEDSRATTDMPEPAQVDRPTQLDSAIENRIAITIPPKWLATITSVSYGGCSNLVRIRRIVDGALETQDLLSEWNATGGAMTLDGSDSNSLALPSTAAPYALVVEAFHSKDPAKKDARKLPRSKDLSRNLRIFTTSRPNDLKSFPDFQVYTIFDECVSGSEVSQNAIITIYTSAKVAMDPDDPGKPDTGSINDGYDGNMDLPRPSTMDQFLSATHPSVRAKVASSSGPRLLYYRVYNADGAIATKRPAYLNDTYLGRIMFKWVAPPHHAGSLKACLSTMENIDPSRTQLFAGPLSKSALADDEAISVNISQTLGLIPEEPLALFCQVTPQDGIKPGTESFLVPPDAESPLLPQFLYYGLYAEGGALVSRKPVDPQQAWVSRIDLALVPPPLNVASLIRSIAVSEGVTIVHGSSQLFVDEDAMTPLSDDLILTDNNGNWPGSSADDHVIFKSKIQTLSKMKDVKTDGSVYWIQNYVTRRQMILNTAFAAAHGIPECYTFPATASPYGQFTFKARGGGAIALWSLSDKNWVGPNFRASAVEHDHYFILSETNKDCFFISSDKDPRHHQVFYDSDLIIQTTYQISWKEFDENDPRQLWLLIPSV